jgi:hypothetical protein
MVSTGRGRVRGIHAALLMALGCALCLSLSMNAQGRGGGAAGGGRQGGGHEGGAQGGAQGQMGPGAAGLGGRGGIPPAAGGVRQGVSGVGSMQNGPVGRWWDDKGYSSALGLKPDQKKRMDAIFNGNRGELADRVQTLRQEEAKLQAATQDTRLSQESIFGQMDRVAAARDALEKTNSRLLESLRKELEPEQLTRMQTLK